MEASKLLVLMGVIFAKLRILDLIRLVERGTGVVPHDPYQVSCGLQPLGVMSLQCEIFAFSPNLSFSVRPHVQVPAKLLDLLYVLALKKLRSNLPPKRDISA